LREKSISNRQAQGSSSRRSGCSSLDGGANGTSEGTLLCAPLDWGLRTKGETLKYLAGAAALASAFVLAGVAAADTTGDVLTLYPVGGG